MSEKRKDRHDRFVWHAGDIKIEWAPKDKAAGDVVVTDDKSTPDKEHAA